MPWPGHWSNGPIHRTGQMSKMSRSLGGELCRKGQRSSENSALSFPDVCGAVRGDVKLPSPPRRTVDRTVVVGIMISDRLERILGLLLMIGNGRAMDVDELAEHFDVARRTVFRDLAVLKRVGVKTSYERLRRRYRVHEGTALQPITVTQNECLALLFLSRKILDAGIWPSVAAAKSAASKLDAALPDELGERCAVALSHFDLEMAPFSSRECASDIRTRDRVKQRSKRSAA